MKLKKRGHRKITANLDMTPLIDVVFQLLIFFMLSATFVVQSSIPIDLPDQNTSAQNTAEQKDITVIIQAEGTIFIEDQPAPSDVAQLAERLKEEVAKKPPLNPGVERLVTIRADQASTTQLVVDVMTACQLAGLNNFGIAVDTARE